MQTLFLIDLKISNLKIKYTLNSYDQSTQTSTTKTNILVWDKFEISYFLRLLFLYSQKINKY